MEGIDWSDKEAIGRLRIADFACGTGSLLSSVYEQIAARHERARGNPAELHGVMMEEVLYGCDVMPSAVHITCSTLSGMEPAEKFGKSRLYALQYGRQEDGSVKIGSLEFLQTSAQWTLFNTSDPATQIGSTGEETSPQAIANIPDESFDLVIMNPPFTSNTAKEAGNLGKFAPAFAAFNTSDKDQKEMAKRMSILKRDTSYHGHAGMASAFAALGDRKLKSGGILALVLPLTASAASSWQALRDMLSKSYTDLTILSIAGAGTGELSFSSDTGMAECLVLARKKTLAAHSRRRTRFVSLKCRPQGFAQSSVLAARVIANPDTREIEDGPYGGTSLKIGDELAGEMITTPHLINGEGWGAVRISDYSLAQAAHALSRSKLWLPAIQFPLPLTMVPLAHVGNLGLYDLDITGKPPQGPFSRSAYRETATYPSLWNHTAKSETHIVCTPDSELLVRSGMESKAAIVWETASRTHLNRDFTFGSQALAVAFTERESIGGRVWPNVIFNDSRFDYIFAVWSNSTVGLLSYWWHASRQQSSKAAMSIRSADSLPVLDLRTLTDAQLAKAEEIFDEFRDKELHPAYLADADPNRALLDRRVIRDLLGFDEDTYLGVRRLAAKWCAEPSVHGGKKRPAWAKFVA